MQRDWSWGSLTYSVHYAKAVGIWLLHLYRQR